MNWNALDKQVKEIYASPRAMPPFKGIAYWLFRESDGVDIVDADTGEVVKTCPDILAAYRMIVTAGAKFGTHIYWDSRPGFDEIPPHFEFGGVTYFFDGDRLRYHSRDVTYYREA